MKQVLLLAFLALSLFITSCGSDNDKDGNWKKGAEYSGAGRGGAVSFTIGDNVYLGLGYSNGDYFSSFYRYSISDNSWYEITEIKRDSEGEIVKDVDGDPIKIGAFPGIARKQAVAFSVNGKGYIGTGIDENNDRLNDFWEYDPSKTDVEDRWTQIEGLPGGIRQGAVAFSFDTDANGVNDVAYVGTGYGKLDGDDQNNLNDFYKYNGNTWSKIGFSGNKTNEATAFVIGTKGYLVSGVSNLDNVWEFDAITETWLQKKDIDKDNHAENVQRTNAVAFVIDGLAYITTGSGQDAREVWEYKPSKDDWVERNDLENEVYSRTDAIGISTGKKGFIVTGLYGVTTGLSDMWEFEPGVKEDDDDND